MENYVSIEMTAKYGDQILRIMEKMTNADVNMIIPHEEKYVLLTKNEYAEVCKELIKEDKKWQ